MGAQFGTVATEILIEQDAFDGGARGGGALCLYVGAHNEERWPSLLVGDGDEHGGAVRLGGGAFLVGDGVVGVVAAVAADVVEQRVDGAGVQRLSNEGLKELFDGVGGAGVGRFDMDTEHAAGRPGNAGGAGAEVFGPLCIVECVFQQLGLVLLGDVVAAGGKLVGLEIVTGGKAGEIGNHEDIGQGAGASLVVLDGDGEAALEDADDGVKLALGDGQKWDADGEGYIRVHVVDGLRGEVVEHATVDVLVAVHLERAVDAGERDGSADGVGD